MPPPTSYTELQLAVFMQNQLGEVATLIDWTTPTATPTPTIGEYQEAINETLIAYGESDIAMAIDIRKLRALARREIWRKVMQSTAGNYRFGSDREQYYRQQVYEQSERQFAMASEAASPYDSADPRYNVGIYEIIERSDTYTPYIYDEEESAVS